MKILFTNQWAALAVAASLLTLGGSAHAQTATTTTTRETTTNGTISSWQPNSFIIRSESATEPTTYGYSATTRYVDDAGAVVSRELITPDMPVTVHYVREGDRLIADRVIVHKTITTTTESGRPLTKREARDLREAQEHPEREARRAAEQGRPFPPPNPSESKTTTTTTTTAADGSISAEGTISEFSPEQIVVRSSTSSEPLTYRYSKTTEYVDDAGSPVAMTVVRSGSPVTISYVREGDRLIARRVVVHTLRR